MTKLYTKQGDKGETRLFGGSVVGKGSKRVNVYGTIDEANSMLGLAYAVSRWDNIKEFINEIQMKMFSVASEIASDEKGFQKLEKKISEGDTLHLESLIDKCTRVTGEQTSFVIPGTNEASAALHLARTIVRRAERYLVDLSKEENVREELIRYLNRLSDAIYALSRLEETMDYIKKSIEDKTGYIVSSAGNSKHKVLNLKLAKTIASYGEEKAEEIGVPIVFTVVDSGGNMITQDRMDGALLASLDISAGKAYTACAFKMPTDELYDLVKPGAPLYGAENSNNGKVIPFGGGYPLTINGEVIGGIGVSGGTVEEDMLIAKYALEKFFIG